MVQTLSKDARPLATEVKWLLRCMQAKGKEEGPVKDIFMVNTSHQQLEVYLELQTGEKY